MKISLEWLGDFIAGVESVDALVDDLTMSGTEVEAVETIGFRSDHVITARIESFVQHPNADRLSVCQVTDGKETRQIVCGAKNFKVGDVVPLAVPGASLPGGFKIKESKLRGELSQGMMCSAKELGLGEGADGLMILDSATPLGVPLHEAIPTDTVLTLEVTPNRADLLSYVGVARELGALGYDRKEVERSAPRVDGASEWSVINESGNDCPRYTLQRVSGVKVGPSPDWLRRRLASVGIRPINNVVDITNYVLLETGQPLHAFDAARLQGRAISVRSAGAGESILALNGKSYALVEEDLVIADGAGPVALAGVMGGELSAVTESTTEIILESAAFAPGKVRRTSRRLALFSDSSYRFERGIDPLAVDRARARAVELLTSLAGATWVGDVVESGPVVLIEHEVALRPERVSEVMGRPVAEETIQKLLVGLGLTQTSEGAWKIPSFRPDLTREIDLVEEVARLEGLASVPARTRFEAVAESRADRTHARRSGLAQKLAAWGYQEWVTNSLLPRSEEREDSVVIANPLNEDYAVLRRDLLAGALPCVARNLAYGQESVLGFEIGSVYLKTTEGPVQEDRLLVIAAGLERAAHWTEGAREVDYFTVKGIVDRLIELFPELAAVEVRLVEPGLRKTHGIKTPVFYAELSLPTADRGSVKRFCPVSSYPAVRRDLAFVVDRAVPHSAMKATLESCGIAELESVVFFDLFVDETGEKLASEKKSLAYALTYRSGERTLTEKDVAGWEEKLLKAAAEKHGAVLRS